MEILLWGKIRVPGGGTQLTVGGRRFWVNRGSWAGDVERRAGGGSRQVDWGATGEPSGWSGNSLFSASQGPLDLLPH